MLFERYEIKQLKIRLFKFTCKKKVANCVFKLQLETKRLLNYFTTIKSSKILNLLRVKSKNPVK